MASATASTPLSQTGQATVIVFCRAPQIGAVKSRLARDIGLLRAWRFYRNCLSGILAETEDPRWHLLLAVTPDRQGPGFRLFAGRGRARPQGSGDLGRRMRSALRAAGPGPVVLVGADIPQLRRGHLHAALDILRRSDAVFGPADDGGYWLVGLRAPKRHRALFQGVRWSGPLALADTLDSLAPGSRVGFVEELTDVDTLADLQRLRAAQRSSRRGINSAKLQGRKRISS